MKKMCWMLLAAALALCGNAATEPEVVVTVTNVVAKQRYPWNGLVDIDYEVRCSDPETNIWIYATGQDRETGKFIAMTSLTGAGAKDPVKAGRHRMTWNSTKDSPKLLSNAFAIKISALTGVAPYLVVDVSEGANAASYPVSYLSQVPEGGWTDEYKTTKIVLRFIEPGVFMMGSPSDELGRFSNEAQHQVTISRPFYMGVFEITQKQWELVMGAKPSYFSNASYYAARPVEYVSYNNIRGSSNGAKWPSSSNVDATSFMGKLRAKTGLATFDLPTEAQWEYACRAGTTTALNSGKNLTGTGSCANMAEVGRYWYNGGSGYSSSCTTSYGTAKVGSYLPNAWGLYDMHGNVYEWCLDWYVSNLGTTAVTDPVGATSGSGRLLRGGGWYHDARNCRSAYRSDDHPSYCSSDCGFRLCCSAGL